VVSPHAYLYISRSCPEVLGPVSLVFCARYVVILCHSLSALPYVTYYWFFPGFRQPGRCKTSTAAGLRAFFTDAWTCCCSSLGKAVEEKYRNEGEPCIRIGEWPWSSAPLPFREVAKSRGLHVASPRAFSAYIPLFRVFWPGDLDIILAFCSVSSAIFDPPLPCCWLFPGFRQPGRDS